MLGVQRLWGSPPEIYRSEVTDGKRFTPGRIVGRKFLFRSDFPCMLFVDGRLIGIAGGDKFPHYFRFQLDSTGAHEVELRFPSGRGGDPAGALAADLDQLGGRHGVCCLEGSIDDEPQLPNPDLLPATMWQFVSSSTGVGAKAVLWISPSPDSYVEQDWSLPQLAGMNADEYTLPQEIWVKSATLSCETPGADVGSVVDEIPYEVLFAHASGAGTNAELATILAIQGGVQQGSVSAPQSVTSSFNNFKIPLRSHFKPWAAETPTINMSVFGPSGGTTDLRVLCRLHASYLM